MVFKYLRLIFTFLLFLCLTAVPASGDNPRNVEFNLKAARAELENTLHGVSGYIGIAHSEGQITVFLENAAARARTPDFFNGFKVNRIVTGKLKALGYPQTALSTISQAEQVIREPSLPFIDKNNAPYPGREVEFRPLKGGITTFNDTCIPPDYYYGTLGMVTYDTKILSNAHVIAMDPSNNFVSAGTPVIQPAGPSGTRVGALQQYIPITFSESASNHADAAVATIDSGIATQCGVQFSESGDYTVAGSTTVNVGDTVRKSGAGSGVTTGTVSYNNATVNVTYGDKTARFVDQIIVANASESFCKGGDSGSCVDKGGKFAGLIFAASDTIAAVCKASYIIDELGIVVDTPPAETAIYGTMGIGTDDPKRILHVSGNAALFERNANSAGFIIQRTRSLRYVFGVDSPTGFVIKTLPEGEPAVMCMKIDPNGNVSIPGTLSKGSGTFKIDHPLDPANMYLSHSFVESPEMLNIYRGNAILDGNGEAIIELPSYFDALNSEFGYQVECIDGFAPVYIAQEINGNRFRIAGGKKGMLVSWEVTGVRQDPFAQAHPITVEQEKTAPEKGTYLYLVEQY